MAGPATNGVAAHVLLVEDDAFIRHALAELLTDEGFAVRTAAHGGEGLAILAAGLAVDFIVLDLVMPEVSGLQFRERQAQRPAWARIPTLVLTADVCAAAGMPMLRGAMLAEKPLNVAELLRMVHSACGAPSR